MRSYIYLSPDRINSVYNQLNDNNVIEVVKKNIEKKQVSTKGKLGMKAGLLNLIRGEASISGNEGRNIFLRKTYVLELSLNTKLKQLKKVWCL